MRTRTRLTTPPGEEPASDEGVRLSDPERYSPALAVPAEPDVPGRYRRIGVVLGILVLLAILGYAGFQLANRGSFQDPSLDDPSLQQPAGDEPGAEAPEEPSAEDPAIDQDPAIEQPDAGATTPAG